MKKLTTLLLVFVLAISTVACGNNKDDSNGKNGGSKDAKIRYIGKESDTIEKSLSFIYDFSTNDNPDEDQYIVVTIDAEKTGLQGLKPITEAEERTEELFNDNPDNLDINGGSIGITTEKVNDNMYFDILHKSFLSIGEFKIEVDYSKLEALDIEYFQEVLDEYEFASSEFRVCEATQPKFEIFEDYFLITYKEGSSDYYTLYKFFENTERGVGLQTWRRDEESDKDVRARLSTMVDFIEITSVESYDKLDSSLLYYNDMVAKALAEQHEIYIEKPENLGYLYGHTISYTGYKKITTDTGVEKLEKYNFEIKPTFVRDEDDLEEKEALGTFKDYEIFKTKDKGTYLLQNTKKDYTLLIQRDALYYHTDFSLEELKELLLGE